MPKSHQEKFLQEIQKADEKDVESLLFSWEFWARPKQLEPPGEDWSTWLVLAGRGFGKTRTGAEWVRKRVESGLAMNIALVADTAADARDIMVEGVTGIMAVSHPRFKPTYEPSKRRLVWPNGARGICYAAESPEALRGAQHDTAWCDEPAKWRNLRKTDIEGGTAWDNLLFGLRVGSLPRVCCTTTPRAIPWVKNLKDKPTTIITTGSSYENRQNLSPRWFKDVIQPYEGTRLGRQEIHAELIEDVVGALWTREVIEKFRLNDSPVEFTRIVIAVDPSVTGNETSDECGIVAAGLGTDGHAYVLSDDSLRASPDIWASRAVKAYHTRHADCIVAETNNGGEMVGLTIRTVDDMVSYKSITASRGKQVRAEPVAALYEQGRVHHVGSFPLMEDEMCLWIPGEKSPNRMDALVWAITELMLGQPGARVLFTA